MARLEDKVAFITGAGSGIAKSAAHIFAKEGAKIVIAEIQEDLGLQAEKLIKDMGREAIFVQTDVT